MRHLLPAVALASAVSLFAAVPLASAQNSGGSASDGSGMGYGMGSGMGPGGMGMGPGMGMGAGMPPMMPGMGASITGQTQQYTCAVGQVQPFTVPVQGLDQTGRPYFFLTNGWYGPYDGFGYPVVTQMIGQYGGTPMQRQSQGYIPSPCPVTPGSPMSAMGGSGWAGMGMASMPMASMPMGSNGMGAPGMSPMMGPMGPGPMVPPGSGVPTSMGPSPFGPPVGPAAPALGGLVGP